MVTLIGHVLTPVTGVKILVKRSRPKIGESQWSRSNLGGQGDQPLHHVLSMCSQRVGVALLNVVTPTNFITDSSLVKVKGQDSFVGQGQQSRSKIGGQEFDPGRGYQYMAYGCDHPSILPLHMWLPILIILKLLTSTFTSTIICT